MRAPRPATGAHWMAYGDRLREATHSARPYEQSARALGAGRSGGQLRGRPASRLGAHFSDDARVLLHSYCDWVSDIAASCGHRRLACSQCQFE